jgi:3-hydroxybutyryl-CoA dehydrogenase
VKIGVLGCGVMGAGIAQLAAASGHDVAVWENSPELLAAGLAKVRKQFDRAAAKGKMTPEAAAETKARVRGAESLAALGDREFVIEAVVEDLAVKKELFARLDAACGPATIFATNTSSLRVADIAAATKRADRFVGLHFFNPAPLTKLVEVVRAGATSEATYAAALGLARSLGKTPVTARDTSGFVVNFILTGTLLSAARALERGLASVEDIDRAMTLGCGHPVGPLALMDLIGLDTVVKIADILAAEHRDPLYECPAFVRRMADKGWHGTKTGKGFYEYAASGPVPNPGLDALL